MNIEPIASGAHSGAVQSNLTRAAAGGNASPSSPAAASADGSLALSSTSLKETLKQAYAIRPDKVAQASALVNNPQYPSNADLDRLAGFLSQRL